MKNILKISLLLLCFNLFNSCSDDEVPSVVTTCVQDEIDTFKAQQNNCNNASVKAFTFKNTTVFAFQDGQCVSDGGTRVITAECNEFCYLGGLAGIVECQGEDFDNAELIEVLWEN